MTETVITIVIGIVCVVLGISNMKGNISSLHSYHRHRVSEEDRIPFGKQVGLGTIVIGIGMIIFGAASAATQYSGSNAFILAGTVIFVISIAFGLGVSFRAMLKYNKGIF